ncbi:MAG: hypothetical protein RR220_07975 [Bacteroidaceae bacterium]
MLTKEEESIICKQYADNRKLKQIASDTEVSESTVMAVLRRNEVQLRCGKRITKEQEEQVVSLYNQEYTITSIMLKSGVKSEQTIYRILSDAKITLRSKK